jgi:hypothetical protein
VNWVALGLWVGIPIVIFAVFLAMAKGSGGFFALIFAEAFAILGFVNTFTSAVALATDQAKTYEYPYRGVDSYLFELQTGIFYLLVSLAIVIYPLLPIVAKERTQKDAEARKIHEDYNRIHENIGDRGYGWRNKKRMLAGKEPLDPLEMTILVTVLVGLAIGLTIIFVGSVFG